MEPCVKKRPLSFWILVFFSLGLMCTTLDIRFSIHSLPDYPPTSQSDPVLFLSQTLSAGGGIRRPGRGWIREGGPSKTSISIGTRSSFAPFPQGRKGGKWIIQNEHQYQDKEQFCSISTGGGGMEEPGGGGSGGGSTKSQYPDQILNAAATN